MIHARGDTRGRPRTWALDAVSSWRTEEEEPVAMILSAAVTQRIATLFPESERAEVAEWLVRECGDCLPGADRLGIAGWERIQAAVLKISAGSLDRLILAIQQAQEDWRDSLVGAGFAEDRTAHRRWLDAV